MTITESRNPERSKQPALNAMTVDVEDYFQVSAFDRYIDRADWKNYQSRVERNTQKLLRLFSEADIQATFFTLGWVAEKFPMLIRQIVDNGHELASHGWDHRMVTGLSANEFREDIRQAKTTLEQVSGTHISGYRAPSYSINAKTDWAHEILAEEGYHYSSSVAPVRHTLYGFPGAPRFRYQTAEGQLTEFPITTCKIAGRNLPCGGGGWFRLYPYQLSKYALRKVNTVDNQAAIFYIHPWEVDPEQPKIRNANLITKFRHYQNLHRTEDRLRRLLKDFTWGTMSQAFDAPGEGFTAHPINQ